MSRVYGGYQNNIGAVQDADGNVSIVAPTKTLIRSVPGYVRFDARAAYKIDKAITLSVNIQNLTDKTYFNQVYASHYASIAPGVRPSPRWRSAFDEGVPILSRASGRGSFRARRRRHRRTALGFARGPRGVRACGGRGGGCRSTSGLRPDTARRRGRGGRSARGARLVQQSRRATSCDGDQHGRALLRPDRKSTRLNSSH